MEVSERWKKILLFSLGTIVGLVVFLLILDFSRGLMCGSSNGISFFNLLAFLFPFIFLILFEILLYFTVNQYSNKKLILLIIIIICAIPLQVLLTSQAGCGGYNYTAQAYNIQEQIKQQVIDDLRTGDKKLVFPASEIIMNKKESKVNAIGIKNVKQGNLKYKLEIVQTGGDKIFGDDINDNFLYPQDIEELPAIESRPIPIRITSETTVGKGQFKVIIKDVTYGEPGVVYDSKEFSITVN